MVQFFTNRINWDMKRDDCQVSCKVLSTIKSGKNTKGYHYLCPIWIWKYLRGLRKVQRIVKEDPTSLIPAWLKIQFFYSGLVPNAKMMIDMAVNGALMGRNSTRLMIYLKRWPPININGNQKGWHRRKLQACTS